MLCADRVCRETFVHCYRALAAAKPADAPPAAAGQAAAPSDGAGGAAAPAATAAAALGDGIGAGRDLLAEALPSGCASEERRARLEEALRRSAELLDALASYGAASRALFPQLCV